MQIKETIKSRKRRRRKRVHYQTSSSQGLMKTLYHAWQRTAGGYFPDHIFILLTQELAQGKEDHMATRSNKKGGNKGSGKRPNTKKRPTPKHTPLLNFVGEAGAGCHIVQYLGMSSPSSLPTSLHHHMYASCVSFYCLTTASINITTQHEIQHTTHQPQCYNTLLHFTYLR